MDTICVNTCVLVLVTVLVLVLVHKDAEYRSLVVGMIESD
jgi:hypothetical protein